MEVTAVGLIVDAKRSDLEAALKGSDLVEDFDLEDLDKNDQRKDLMISFKNPIDVHYVGDKLVEILGEHSSKLNTE